MSCIQQILCHGTSHVSQAYKPNGLSLREIRDKVSQETNALTIIKQVFTTYFSELSNNPEKKQTRNTTLLLFVRYAPPPPKTPLWKQSNA